MNEDKFTGKADNYDRYRPSYPAELISWLYYKTEAETAADIGAGTGKLTQCLTSKPWKITAVEPNRDMAQKLRKNVPDAEIIEASAENTGIAERSIGLVTAASAFHWFDEGLFREECRRILTPDGRLALIIPVREETPLIRERREAARIYCGFKGYAGKRSRGEMDSFLRKEYFSEVEYAEFGYVHSLDEDGFVGEALSRSYAPSEGDVGYEGYVYELRQMFAKYCSFGTADIRYNITCYLGKF